MGSSQCHHGLLEEKWKRKYNKNFCCVKGNYHNELQSFLYLSDVTELILKMKVKKTH